MDTKTKDKFEQALSRFTGSTQLYKHKILDNSITFTEGVKYVADEGHAWWLPDLILSYQWMPRVSREEFQVWILLKQKDETWTITCTDGNDKVLCGQHLAYSDFPIESLKLYVVDNTIMLPSEY
ncbi:MAG TPA: hypothetical protein VNW99_10995 [Cytophagaceae bacterium]|jgi:hypothetical protein|nr:hypothetical protein [Cytophagaceae bacterium]